MAKTNNSRKRKTAEQKLAILQDINKLGTVAGCRKHNIAAATYLDWKTRYNSNGIEGLGNNRQSGELALEFKKLQKEASLLKELLIEKDLQLKLQADLIKKKMQAWKK
jgi:hypothetical protein